MIYFLKKNEKALNEEKDQQSNTFVNCMNGCCFFFEKYKHTETHPHKNGQKPTFRKKELV